MPFVTVKIAKGHSIDQKQLLVQAITNTLVSILGAKPEWVTVYIDEFERENWAVGGQIHADKSCSKHDEKVDNKQSESSTA